MKIFIAHNQSEIAENTALRLKTLAGLYGIEILLPDQVAKKTLQNIENADVCVAIHKEHNVPYREQITRCMDANKPITLVKVDKQIISSPSKLKRKQKAIVLATGQLILALLTLDKFKE